MLGPREPALRKSACPAHPWELDPFPRPRAGSSGGPAGLWPPDSGPGASLGFPLTLCKRYDALARRFARQLGELLVGVGERVRRLLWAYLPPPPAQREVATQPSSNPEPWPGACARRGRAFSSCSSNVRDGPRPIFGKRTILLSISERLGLRRSGGV